MSEVPHRLEQSSELDYIRIADHIALAVGILVYQQQPTAKLRGEGGFPP